MINIVAIGKTEDKANKIASWIVGGKTLLGIFKTNYQMAGRSIEVIAEPIWPGCKKAKSRGDVVLVSCMEPTDLVGIEEYINHYMNVAVKFIIYDGTPAQADKEKEWSASGFPIGDPQNLINMLEKAHDDISKLVKNVFEHFDHDKSGFIDLKELTEVAKELGVLLPPAEAEVLYKELDDNKDGKISLEEFTLWWRSGRQGKSYKLSDMVMRGIKKSNSLSLAASMLDQYGGLKDLKEEDKKLINSQLSLHFNKVKNVGGIMIHAMFMTQGKALDAHLQQYGSCLSFPAGESYMALAFGCKKDPKVVCETAKELVETAYTLIASTSTQAEREMKRVKREYGVSPAKKVIVGLGLPEEAFGTDTVLRYIKMAFPDIHVEQNIDLFLKLATDFAKLSTETRTLLDVLLDGVSLNLDLQILQQFANKVAMMNSVPGMPLIMAQIIQENGMYANKLNGELEFEVDAEMKAKFGKKLERIVPPMPCCALKGMLSGMAKGFMESMPILSKTRDFVKDDIDSIEIFIPFGGKIGVKIYMELPGMDTFLNF